MTSTLSTDNTPMPTIDCIELTPVFVPFREEIQQLITGGEGGIGMALEVDKPWMGGDFVICRLIAEDGSVGLGEAFVWLPETGVSPNTLISIIKDALSGYILGKNPYNVEQIRHDMDANLARSDVAKGVLDMACYDLMGKIAGRPAHDFMGGKSVNEIPLGGCIALADMAQIMKWVSRFQAEGMKTFRLKLGRSIQDDAHIVAAIRDKVGLEARLRVDYNQAYRPDAAIRAIKAIEPFGIDFIEQPVSATDFLGMAYVQRHVDTPLMAHEGCFGLQDIVTLIELGAVRVVGINGERPGGVTNALRAIDYAEQRGLSVVLHNQPLGIGSAMMIHLAAAKHHSLGHSTELLGQLMTESDLLLHPIDYSNGTAKIPEGPGWGVELNMSHLDKYATAERTVIKRA